jgi:hypothetical protein
MTKASNIASIEKSTGKQWDEWLELLNKADAKTLSHLELSKLVEAELQGVVDSPSWWAQSVTVAYEQAIGRRVPGQLANGLFELAVSKAVIKPRDVLFAQAVEWFEGQSILDGKEYTNPRQTTTPKRSNWRCDFEDGSKFAVTVEGNEEKSKLVLSHTAVPTQDEANQWKAYWASVADTLKTI